MEFNLEEDQALMDALPDHLQVGGLLLKATPVTEGARRFIYIEAANEERDLQNEVLLSKALADQADYYLKFGNLDIDHYTQIGAKRGIPNYESFEIGRPVAVRIEDGTTFVKGEIFTGEGMAGERANLFWSSITDINPPQRWYPSVGGAVIERKPAMNAKGERYAVITKVRWSNIGFSKTPVNDNLSTISTEAFGPLAKSWGAAMMLKGLEAGGGSDVAGLTGGAALRVQSFDKQPMNYWDFRDQLSALIQRGELGAVTLRTLKKAAKRRFGLSSAVAAQYVEQFLNDLGSALKEKQ